MAKRVKAKIIDLTAIKQTRAQPRRTYIDAYLDSLSNAAFMDHFWRYAERMADKVGDEGFPRFREATLRELLDGWFENANDMEAEAMLVEVVLRGRAVGLPVKEYMASVFAEAEAAKIR
jgi:hypothetical protein